MASEIKSLVEIVKIKGGKRLPKGESLQTDENKHPYIRVRDMGGRYIPKDGLEYVPENVFQKISRYIVEENDVIISIVGTVGLVSIIDKYFHKASQTENCAKLSGLSEVDAKYLYYYLISPCGQQEISTYTVGAVQPKLPLYGIESISVPWFKASKRAEIAHTLGSLDDKIELNRQMNATLEAMAQALFKSWFIDFDPVIDNALAAGNAIPDEFMERAEQRRDIETKDNSDIQNLFPNEFECTEEMGWIPKGWGNGTLSDICFFGKGKINTSELSLENYVSTENMNKEKAGISYAASIASTNQVPKFSVGQTLISNIRPYFKKIWLASFDGGRSNDVLGFQANNSAVNEYLFNLLYQDSFFDYMTATSKGTKMPRGDKAAIMSWSVAIPSSKLMEEFSELAKPMYLANNLRSLQTIELAKLRDTLLPKLMSGEIRIPDAAVWVEEI